ncbi:hypothetical protein [Nakamurella multipartita]|nr:hypothetical protein [Nakamurella multipartita]
MFVLTKYTRDGSRNRQTVIQGFEMPLRKLVIILMGLAVSIVPTVFAAVFVDYWAMLIPLICVAAALWLVEHRTRDGLRVPMWQSIKHRYEEPIDQFLCGGRPVNPLATGYFRIIPSSVHVVRAEVDAAEVFSPLPHPHRPAATLSAAEEAAPAAGRVSRVRDRRDRPRQVTNRLRKRLRHRSRSLSLFDLP